MAQDAAMPSEGASALAVAFGIIMSFGGVSNAMVVATHIHYRKNLLKEFKDILIFSLALGDLIMTSLVCPLGFSSAVANRWTTGRTGCIFYGFTTTWVGLSCMLQLALVALERFYTLSRPSGQPVSKRRAVQVIVGAWLFALGASCLPLFGWSKYTPVGFGLHCAIVWSTETRKYAWYCLFLLVVFFALPVSAIIISYGKMFRVVKKIYRNATAMWGPEAQSTRESYMAQVKVTKQVMVVTGGFLFAWSPYAVMSMIKAFTGLKFAVGVYELPPLFTKTSNIYNPVIYFFMYKRLRTKTFQMLRSIWKRWRS